MKIVNVLIVDDQALIRDGLKSILNLEPDMQIVGTARNGVEACAMAADRHPDVVLLDIRMPEMDGVTCAGAIRAICPEVKIIMLTTFNDDQYIMAALANQANGYLLKDIEIDQLVESIHAVAQGKMILPPEVAAKLAEGLTRMQGPPEKSGHSSGDLALSGKEREIAEMMTQGYTNRQIAAALYMAEGTVRNYISAIYARLGISDRTQAVLYLKEHGF